jgi:hypothetical protein
MHKNEKNEKTTSLAMVISEPKIWQTDPKNEIV